MKDILAFEGVRFGWNRHEAPLFSDLSFRVPRGKATALLGPNGAGKTTLMDLALGWRAPQGGRILLEGRPLGERSARQRGRRMALVPQDETIPFDYSVTEYILLGRAPHLPPLAGPGSRDRAIAREALEQTGIVALAHRKVTRLSGGERQMVLLARALTQQPRLLLLDEPASHLDLHNKEKILRILEQLKRGGISLFFTSHDPDLVMRLADEAVLLKKGRLIRTGPSEAILNEADLGELYEVPVKMGVIEGRRVLIWGEAPREEG